MQPDNPLPWITALTFLAYIPILCYLDWKHRDIQTHAIWIPLIFINSPFLWIGYLSGIYPIYLIIPSAIGIIAWGILTAVGILPGGDFWFLSMVSIFMVINPKSGQPFIEAFSLYLMIFTAAAFWYIILDNLIINKKPLKECLHIEKGLPFMIPISCAVIMALVMG